MKKKEKVGVVTLFNCYNYGAVLQAYATCKFLEKLGYNDVELVNYENKYESKLKKTIPYIFSGNVKDAIKRTIQFVFFGKNRHLKKGFKEFCNSLKKSTKKYKNTEELKKTNYDILISGSDQIWNPVIFGKLDLNYLLDFSSTANKLSISSSAGSYHYSLEEKKEVVRCLKKYKAIAVREESLKAQLQDSIDDIFVSVDPTLLLSKEDWIEALPSNNKYGEENSNYVLIYIVDANLKNYSEEIRILKEKINKPIWMITPYKYKMKYIDKNIVSATPNDFISLFKNAEFVITNSFHGVIFSTNFMKKFVALENHKNPVRVHDYLSGIGIENRIVKNADDAQKINLDEINFEYYNTLMKTVEKTKNWIGDKIVEK